MSGEDLSSALITPKPVTPITHYQCPTLKLTNYTVWAIQIKVILEAHGLWEMIEPKENTQVDEKKDKATTAFLYQALIKDVLLQVAGCKSAKELWESLKKRHVGEEKVQQARLQSLMIGFQTLQMKEDDSVDAFTAKLNGYATKAKEFGKTLDQSLLVRKLLDSTHQIGGQAESQENLLFAQGEHSKRGRRFGNHGGRSNFSRGNWQHNKNKYDSKEEGSTHKEKSNTKWNKREWDMSKVQCHKCRKLGHFRKDCTQSSTTQEQSNLIQEDEEPSLLMATHETKHEKVLLNEGQIQPGKYTTTDASIWYLDNGAGNHMAGTKIHFRDIDENITGRICFGDGSYVEIKGKGSILLGCRNHEQKIISEAKAVRHAIYILNRVPTRALVDETPHEALYNRKPNLENLRIFGCTAYAKITIPHLQKLEDRSIPMIYLGIEEGSKAYRLYDPKGNTKHVSRDVKFMETKPWDWDNNREENSIQGSSRASLVVEGFENGNTTSVNSGNNTDNHQEQEPITALNSPITPQTYTYNPNSEEEDATICSLKNSENGFDDTPVRGFKDLTEIYENARIVETESLLFTEEEPRNYKEASTDKKWIEAIEIELDSINKNNTWTLTTLPTNHKAIGLKWVFKTKRDAKGEIIKYKARLVAKGYVQEQGIDFDEVFAPVARIETVRLILALAAYHEWQVHHLDVKSAFLHGELKEEVYVTQPEGFIQQGKSGKVYKLTKALYGLRQAPRAWNMKLDQTLKSLGFKKCNLEQAVYTKKSKTSTLIVGVYVDDLIITGTPRKEIDLFKSQMKDKFEMSDLGLLAYYLGIEVTQKGGEITIKQTGYINKILKDANMMESNDTKIPMDPGTKLVKAEDGNSVDATYYRSLIGCLRFMQEPKDHHLKAIKQVIRYIKGIKEHGIIYKKDGGCKITGYSDSSYGINTDQGKGTTKIVLYFGESPITWCTQKQPTVALSSCESEFMAATGAACQALWLKRLLSEITGWEEERITLKVDNISAIALVRNPVFHGRSKHIYIRYHFIRECIEN
ncbi:ribonuclease H-like domain, reverse transcriptase, RNA-dependent DNA polymerase [Tanacetum coccineum]